MTRRSLIRLLLVATATCLGCAAHSTGDGARAPAPESVKPGINERFLSPDLDPEDMVAVFEGESREIFVHRREIAAALGLGPGTEVADVGAGTGLFLGLLADGVGASGKVYAVDISPRLIEYMRERVETEGLTRVEVVQSSERAAGLPEDSVDVVFLCDTYHHFEYPGEMLASLHSVLRPGGRFVVVDFERIPGVSREWVLDHIRAGKQETIAEITAAGFELENERPIEGLVENYLLVFKGLSPFPQTTP